jgi:hypothetical protein
MSVIRSLKMNFAIWIKWIIGKKRARIGYTVRPTPEDDPREQDRKGLERG